MKFLLFLAPLALCAQTVTISVDTYSATQAALHVTALNSDSTIYIGACSYRASEGATIGTLVNDVNPALFAGSNLDTRPGSVTSGSRRTFVLGTRTSNLALDGSFYSRALQTNTLHTVGVTCGSAAEVRTSFTTRNVPYDVAYPEAPNWDANAPGNVATPTINQSDRTKSYIDPLSGVLLKRLTGDLDYTGGKNPGTIFAQPYTPSGWTNIANATASSSTSTYASSSTQGAVLFLPWAPVSGYGAWPYAHNGTGFGSYDPSDIQLAAFCQGTGGAILVVGPTIDSGQTWATGTQEVPCGASFASTKVPAAYPKPVFSDWAPLSKDFRLAALKSWYPSNVSVTAHVVTWTGGDLFYAYRAPGSKLLIPGSSAYCTASLLCTVASWDSATQITIVENFGSTVTAAMQDYGAGFRVVLKATGGSPTVNANFTYDYITSQHFDHGSNSEAYICSTLPITDILTDASGVALPAALSGMLCNVGYGGSELGLFIPSTGEWRFLSAYINPAGNRFTPFGNPFSTTDSKKLLVTDNSNAIWTGVIPGPPYLSWNPLGAATDGITWTSLTAGTTPIATQVASAGGAAATALASGLFGTLLPTDIVGGNIFYYTGGYDQPCIAARADLTNTLIDVSTSWDKYPARWGACHGSGGAMGPYLLLAFNALVGGGNNYNGPFNLTISQMRRAGVWTSATGISHMQVASINIAASPTAVVTTVGAYGFSNGDPVVFRGDPANTQYYAKSAGYTSTTFGLYANAALTTAVTTLTAPQVATFFNVGMAEACPTSNPPWDQATNLDSGAVGNRCITVRVTGEPCSITAKTAEHNATPCPSDPSNAAKSWLQNIAPGDAIRDTANNGYMETMTLVKKVTNSSTDIELTFSRWTPNKVQGGDDSATATASSIHLAGWVPYMVPSNSHACVQVALSSTDPTHTWVSMDSNYCSGHGDIGSGLDSAHITFSGGTGFRVLDSVFNVTPAAFLSYPLTYTENGLPAWQNNASSQLDASMIQSYPTHRQVNAPAGEQVWKGDWKALNQPFGGAPGAGGPLYTGTVSAAVSGTSHVYKISNGSSAYARKITPTYAWAGRWMFKDKSGPGSLIVDADAWNYCVADFAGECRPGSSVNDTFISMPIAPQMAGVCYTNTADIVAPCFVGLHPLSGWAIQDQISPLDVNATKVRKLTLGLNAPGMHTTFSSWHQTPGGVWGFFAPFMLGGMRTDYFAMKLPPWPGNGRGADNVNRKGFVSYAIKLPPSRLAYARVRFGYAENGPAGSFYCTTRLEACSTDPPTGSPTDPFSWMVSETSVVSTSCSAGCTINVPAVPGRALYYVVDRLDGSRAVVSSTPLSVTVVP